MNTGAFGENFPYSNFHDLNMDWIIKIAKDFLDQYTHIQDVITQGETGLQEKYDTLNALLDAWYNTHSEDIANQLALALEDLNNWYNAHQNYLNETLANNINEFNRRADLKAEQTLASIPDDYTALANAVTGIKQNTLKPLLIMTNTSEDQYFSISSVRSSLPGTYYKYTITAIRKESFSGISAWETGPGYQHYTFTYEHGCNNTGTSAIAYKYDDTIESEDITGYGALVVDRSDFKIKIISSMALTENQRVLALFFGNGDPLQRSITAYGNNHRMFSVRNIGFNKFYPINGNNFKGMLTLSYNATSRIYTITVNNSNGFLYGITENENSQVSIGANGVAGIDYPFPASFSSGAIAGMAVIVATRGDYTTTTWKIIDFNEMQLNRSKYIVLGIVFRSSSSNYLFFSNNAREMFTNYKSVTEISPANRLYAINGQRSDGALTLHYDEETYIYTITRNSTNFFAYCVEDDATAGQVAIGSEDVANMHYPFPASFSSAPMRTGFAYIVATKADNTTSTWKIITPTEYVNNFRNYLLMGVVYHNNINCFFFSEIAKNMFTNYSITPVIFDSDLYKAFRKVGVVGDSLAVGFLWNKTTQQQTPRALEYSWPKQVMKQAGVPWLNFGTSGQGTLTWYSSPTYGKVQALASGNKCQAYIIGLGQNDQNPNSSGYAQLGTPADITTNPDAPATTYYGGYSRIIALIKRINSSAKIFCLTNPRLSSETIETYNDAVRYIANEYYASDDNVMLVDLAKDYTEHFNGNSYLSRDYRAIEGGHYSPAGYSRIATIMTRAISETMEKYVTSMYNIGQIPYDTGDPTPDTMTV